MLFSLEFLLTFRFFFLFCLMLYIWFSIHNREKKSAEQFKNKLQFFDLHLNLDWTETKKNMKGLAEVKDCKRMLRTCLDDRDALLLEFKINLLFFKISTNF